MTKYFFRFNDANGVSIEKNFLDGIVLTYIWLPTLCVGPLLLDGINTLQLQVDVLAILDTQQQSHNMIISVIVDIHTLEVFHLPTLQLTHCGMVQAVFEATAVHSTLIHGSVRHSLSLLMKTLSYVSVWTNISIMKIHLLKWWSSMSNETH